MWSVEFVNESAVAEFKSLPQDLQAKLERIADLIEANGLAAMREPYVKHLQDKLWEIRLKGQSGLARSLYITATDQRVVILRTFTKKTQRTPRREIDLALARAKEVK